MHHGRKQTPLQLTTWQPSLKILQHDCGIMTTAHPLSPPPRGHAILLPMYGGVNRRTHPRPTFLLSFVFVKFALIQAGSFPQFCYRRMRHARHLFKTMSKRFAGVTKSHTPSCPALASALPIPLQSPTIVPQRGWRPLWSSKMAVPSSASVCCNTSNQGWQTGRWSSSLLQCIKMQSWPLWLIL